LINDMNYQKLLSLYKISHNCQTTAICL